MSSNTRDQRPPSNEFLVRRLSSLEEAHPSCFNTVFPPRPLGGKPREGFLKFRHSVHMLSLDNALNEEERRACLNRIEISVT